MGKAAHIKQCTIADGIAATYAAGVTHRGPYKNGPGKTNVAIAIAGIVIEPGDIIVGDEDGFYACHCMQQPKIWFWQRRSMLLTRQAEKIADGLQDCRWIDKAIATLGCPIEKWMSHSP